MSASTHLPAGITVFERGWLSSNNILICGKQSTALIDSGYNTHATQTQLLVEQGLGGRPLDVLVNTHLHSDHCGGNAMLQKRYPALKTHIPPGLSESVRNWDPIALTYTPTGQHCPQFSFDGVLVSGSEINLGGWTWQVHAAPGHDPHSVVLFEPTSRILVSADALWEHGFGVVFPELEGDDAFAHVGATIDVIESLAPRLVIPGHGAPFTDVAKSVAVARKRLDAFLNHPADHVTYAVKALLMFKLLEFQRIELSTLIAWAESTPFFAAIHARNFPAVDSSEWVAGLVSTLVKSGAASREGFMIRPAVRVRSQNSSMRTR